METLPNIDPVMSDQNLKGLRKLYTDVEANTRSLKALGVEAETCGAMLASMLLGKLPPDLIVGRKTADAELTLRGLKEVVEEELTARQKKINPNQSQSRPRNDKPPRSTTTTLLSGSQSEPVCCYCQQLHASTEGSFLRQMGIALTAGRFLRQMGIALTAYVADMSGNADPRTTVNSAKGSVTPASVKEGGHRTPTCHNRLLLHICFESQCNSI